MIAHCAAYCHIVVLSYSHIIISCSESSGSCHTADCTICPLGLPIICPSIISSPIISREERLRRDEQWSQFEYFHTLIPSKLHFVSWLVSLLADQANALLNRNWRLISFEAVVTRGAAGSSLTTTYSQIPILNQIV